MHSGNRSADPRPAEPQTARSSGLLSPGERALWFLHRLAPESAAYNLAGALRIVHLDSAALRRAVLRLVERHAALRTTFPAVDGEPFRRVQGWLEPEIVEEDASALACAAVRERFEAEALRPFEPERGPLLRVRLFQIDNQCGGEGAALFVFHHLIADFWSLTIILRELGELYSEETGGAPAELLPPPALYEQWVERRTLELAGPRGEALRAFWAERLARPVPLLDLPADRPRPATSSGAGVGGSGRLSGKVTARLQSFARERGATLFATVLAGFQLLLHRTTGDEEIWIGVPAAGRGPSRWARTVGYFVNPVVLRGRLPESVSFRELADRARTESEEALAHRDWPFPWLAEELHPVRDGGRTPLFQAMLVLYRTRSAAEEPLALLALGEGGGAARLGGLAIETLPLGRRGSQLDISLTAAVVAGELRFRLELDADRFDAATARRLLDRLEALLEAAAARPDAPADDLPLLRGAERQALFLEWNDPHAAAPVEGSLDTLVAAQAERTPHATALVSAERRLSYRELMGRAECLAQSLRALGAGPEVRVGICAGRSAELVIGILAILRSGAAYVPLDPAHPRERLAWTLEDSGAALLVTESSRLPLFSDQPGGVRTVLLDALQDETGPPPATPPAPDPHRLAYILYTSGSTGRPKGVALEHAGALALLRWAGRVFTAGELEGVVASTSIAFDLSVFELFLPLSRGGTVILVPDALHAGAAPGVTLINVTLINTVPSAMAELVRLGAVPSSVRVVCLAGERLPGELAAAVHRAVPGCRVLNLYGPTESTTYSTWFEVEPENGREPAIGWPVDGTRVHLLDRRLRPLPIGVAGELFLAGAGLARGYVGRPDLTAERFVPDPWSPEPGGRLYRTGDLGRWRPDGVLEIFGRLDQQVKLRGFRIELGEVEAALTAHLAVRDAAVEVRGDAAGDRRLVAWVVPGGFDPAALRDHLAARLPGPMVPSTFVPLDALPLTPNGKVDRRALAARPLPEEGPAAGYVPPRNSVEDSLAAVFAEVLGREQVGAQDDFFALGGHSLLATRVLARVGELFRVDLPLRDLFEAPTPTGLAERLRNTARGRTAPPIRRGPSGADEPVVLSFAQERFWFLHRLEPDTPAYNVAGAVRIRGPLRIAALEQALGEIVRRHEVLRTRFPEVDGAPVARVDPAVPGPLSLPWIDLAGLAAERREAVAERLAAETAAAPFDLADGPLLRAVLIRLGAEEHDLFAAVHHIAADGASIDLFFRELAVLYREPGSLPELAVQYADYARWQRAWLTGDVLEARLAWWEQELAGAPTALDLPTDRPRSAASTSRGGLRAAALAPGMTERLDALRRPLLGTRFMTFAAVFQTLLGRLSGQPDVLIGTPVSERSRRELEPLIGCLINTLVLRGRMADDPTFEEQLRRIRATSLAIWAHQDLPFERLVERLPGARDAGRTPLFQALLTSQAEPEAAMGLGDAAVALRELDSGAAKLDMSLTLEASAAGLRSILRYRSDLFDAATAQRFLESFETLLAGGLADPSLHLSELPLLGEAQRHQILAEWGEGEPPRPATLPVHELIRRQSALAPDEPAVFFEGRAALSWRELRRRSLRLARSLRAQGAVPGTVVGISLDRSIELVVAVLGTLETGAAYLPLDPSYPEEYLAYVVEDSGVSIVLSQDSPFPLPEPGEEPAPLPGPPLPLEAWAYVLYTSGSTGKPKGTPVTHRALLNYLDWALDEPLAATDGALFLTSLNFDASLKQLFAPLLQGKPVRLVADESARRPERLLVHLHDDPQGSRRLALNCVPSLWRALLDLLEAGPEPAAARVPALTRLLLGGEGFDRDLLERTHRLLPGLEIWNLYGPTEATANASAARLADDDRFSLGIGRPLRGVCLHVLDPFGGPVPLGTAGELGIGGAGVAQGYWKRPELTAERFVPDPFGVTSGARVFRTGDLARWRPDGSLELQGRIDRQLKIRGLRIEPGEVEAVLASHPAVAECVVGTDPAGSRLVAWVVPRTGSALLAIELRRYLEERLPASLVPAAFVVLGAMPRLPNGKVSHAALPPPEAPVPRASAAVPRSQAEEVLAWLWCEVLEQPEIGVHDDFFERGGHSLLAARLLSRVRAVFAVDLPLRTLFAAPTVARLAEAIAAARRNQMERPQEAVPVEPVPRTEPLPLSFAQERLWFIDQWIPESPAYNIPAAVRLRGPLDVVALAAALAEIVRRHETLRTTFAAEGGRPVQIIHPGLEIPLPVIDLERAAAEGWRDLAGEEARRGFDLERGPLLRTTLLRLEAPDHVLVVNLHHIVSDGWSMGVLVDELRTLYAAFHEGRTSPLPALPVQYVDYAVWQRRLVEREALAQDVEWWRSFLADAPAALELPADRPRPLWSIHRGAVEPVSLPPELTAGLHRLARQADMTLFMILLAAFELLLARLAGVEDLVVGTAVAQRTPEVERLIGLFVNLLPLRGDLSGDPPFTDLLARTRRATLEANDHQDVPFERLVAALEPARDPGRHPLFQAALTLQNAPMPEAILPGLDLAIEQLDTGTARFDLTLLLHEGEAGLTGALEHSADLFDRVTVRRLLASFESLLAGIVDDPYRPVSRLPLLSTAERRQILEAWSPSDDQALREICLPELFGRQAARTPEAVALVDLATGAEITYRELDRRSALLAWRLRQAGAAPDVPVAVLLERSADMVVSLLGVLRAGAGYVPLDLGYPRERLAWMLEDSGARLVVTRGNLAATLAAQGLEIVPIDDLPANETPEAPVVEISPDHLAYIVYTSGSTGKPKGVAATHRGVTRVVIDPGYVELGPEETILQLAPVPFDASTFEIWGALLNGGRLVVFPAGPVSLRELSQALTRHRVTTLFLTTGLFHQMIDEEPRGLAGVRQLITGGDVISVGRVRRALETLPGCRLIHAYGPTETTTFATCHPVSLDDTARPTLTLGRPIPRTSVWLLDERLEPVPPGVPGEMYLGGDGLARGYWRRPDQTASRFVPHPFAAIPGERLYRTGDLARWLPDGTVDFLGRIDRQVKIRGFRVEPAEIETTLERHPDIVSAVVQPRDDGRGNKRLVGWIVPAGPGVEKIAESDLLAWCREHLPAFMVPGVFVPMEALPLDPNGKVDRKALPEPDPGPRGHYVAPRTPLEGQVAAVWSEVLKVDPVGAEDDFFELGGHSLLATQIVARLERELGIDLGLRAFFDEPTVAGVALAITREQMRREDPERMARLLAQVQNLSPEELQRLLREGGA